MEVEESFRVLVRVRPDDRESYSCCVELEDEHTCVVQTADGRRQIRCSYDFILGPEGDQASVYEQVSSCTEAVLNGYNATILAYGQTGTGKTYTMYGPSTTTRSPSLLEERVDTQAGLIPRVIRDIFRSDTARQSIEFQVNCSFVQVYNEGLYDMLRDPGMSRSLAVREQASGEVYVQGLSEYSVKGVREALQLLTIAEENRVLRTTHMNQFSSRSHSVFSLTVVQKRLAEDGGEVVLRSKYALVDLAGSEKWSYKQSMAEAHISELANINLSLHTLGRCVAGLAKRSSLKGSSRDIHIPFRDSKLTRLLQDGLSGNAKTLLIATVSSATENVEETISTLKFADRAGQVMVSASVNETRPVDHALVTRLRREVITLKELIRQITSAAASQSALKPTSPRVEQPPSLSLQPTEIPAETPHDLSPSPKRRQASPTAHESDSVSDTQLNLQEGRERSRVLELENARLRALLERQSATPTVGESHKSSPVKLSPAKHPGALLSVGLLEEMILMLRGAQQTVRVLWEYRTAIERTMGKFFKYEIEEEELQRRLDQEARSLVGLESPAGLLAAVLSTLSRLQTEAGRHSLKEPKALASLTPIKKHLPPLLDDTYATSVIQSVEKTTLSPMKIGGECMSPNNLFQLRRIREKLLVSPRSSRTSGDAIVKESLRRHETKLSPIQVQPRGQRRIGPSTSASKEKLSPLPLLKAEDEESEQEALVLRRIAATEQRLQKNARLQEWMSSKESKARSSQEARMQEQQRQREEGRVREERRQEQAVAQKQRLAEYHDRVRREAAQIKTLLAQGVDPKDVLSRVQT